MRFSQAKRSKGFTLIELIVAIAIVTTLSTIIYASVNRGRVEARDAARRQSMLQVQVALEVYRQATGKYPITFIPADPALPDEEEIEMCNGLKAPAGLYESLSSGQLGWSIGGSDPNSGWIPGLLPAYISGMPVDRYAYTSTICTNAGGSGLTFYGYKGCDGANYSLIFYCAMEKAVPPTDPFYDASPARVDNTKGHMIRGCKGPLGCGIGGIY